MKNKYLSLLFVLTPLLTFAQELTIDEKIEAKFKPFADHSLMVGFKFWFHEPFF